MPAAVSLDTKAEALALDAKEPTCKNRMPVVAPVVAPVTICGGGVRAMD
jgi:hypothetical protein